MTHSGTTTTTTCSGCFSGIARLLLCTRSLQTHPSDEILTKPQPTADQTLIKHSENSPLVPNSKFEAPATTTTPGVVARLMGLDWLPDTKCGRSTPDLVSRSKSVNFMDYLVESDVDLRRVQHRRVRTSVSFREDPNVQDSDLLVFVEKSKRWKKSKTDFENLKRRKELEQKKKKKNAGNSKRKQEEKVNMKDAERRKQMVLNERQKSRICSCKGGRGGGKKDGIPVKKVKIPVNQKEVIAESTLMKKMKKNQSDCSSVSEDSSRISVLDDHEFLLLHQFPLSEKKCPPKSTNFNTKGNKSREGVENEKKINRTEHIEQVTKVRRLTDEDMKEFKWVIEFESSTEEICLYYGEQIMDLLLEELVE